MENAIMNSNRSLLLSSLNCKGFKQLLDSQSLVDCTLACEGGKISAHKIVLSACSSYLAKILLEHPVEHPIIILPELSIEEVRTLIHYMYTGELLKSSTLNSTSLLRTAAILSVNSLNDLLAAGQQQQQQAQQALLGSPLDQLLQSSVSSMAPAALFGGARLPLNSASLQQQCNLGLTPATAANTFVSLLSNFHQRNLNSSLSSSSASSSASTSSSASSSDLVNVGRPGLLGAAAAGGSSLGANLAQPPQSGSISLINHQLNFVNHNKSASSNEFQFKCPVCQNNFQTICSFEYHMQRIHNVTSFGCEICQKPFASLRYVLTDHMRRCHGISSGPGGGGGGGKSTATSQQQAEPAARVQQHC